MDLPKTFAALFRKRTSRTQGILLSCVALISLTSLAGHLLGETYLTNWAGNWSITIPSASVFLLLALQFTLTKREFKALLGATIVVASAVTLTLGHQGYSAATALVQASLALALISPDKLPLRAISLLPAWLCVLQLSTLALGTKPGPFSQFLQNRSQPTAISGLCLAYLALTAAEPYAFRRPRFQLKHFFYTLAITAGLLALNVLNQTYGTDLSSIFIASILTVLGAIGIAQRFENRRLNNRNEDLLKTLDKTAIVVITDPRGCILHINEAFTARYGYTKAEAIGETHKLIASDFHDHTFWSDVWNALRNGQIWQGKICNKSKSGQRVWLDATLSPLPDDNGQPELFLAIYFDISERIENEARLARSRDRQSSMLRSLQTMTEHRDRLVKLIAHDLRSPLANVLAIAETNQLEENASTCETIARMTEYTRKALGELEEFLAAEENLHIAKHTEPDETFDPELEVLEEWQNHNLIAEQKGIRVTMPKSDLYNFQGPRHLFVHVLRNLLSNAVKYTPKNGYISIDLRNEENKLVLTVDDSGPGIPPEKRSTIFTPFQLESQDAQVPSPIKSWGIGLSIAYDLLKTKNGSMHVLDSPLGGARFQAEIPGQHR